jgi:hypothetical protein
MTASRTETTELADLTPENSAIIEKFLQASANNNLTLFIKHREQENIRKEKNAAIDREVEVVNRLLANVANSISKLNNANQDYTKLITYVTDHIGYIGGQFAALKTQYECMLEPNKTITKNKKSISSADEIGIMFTEAVEHCKKYINSQFSEELRSEQNRNEQVNKIMENKAKMLAVFTQLFNQKRIAIASESSVEQKEEPEKTHCCVIS